MPAPVLLGLVGLGAVLAALGVGRDEDARVSAIPADAVAVVNGQPIPRTAYERAAQAVEADRGALDTATRRRLLDRLIEEELLVQHALALGLGHTDPRVRTDLGRAALALETARAETEVGEPDEAALLALYDAEPARFSVGPRVRLEVAWFGERGSDRATAQARCRLARDAARTTTALPPGDPLPVPLPAGPLTMRDVRRALGPGAADAAARLRVDEVAGPLWTSGGCVVLRLKARAPGAARPFDEVRDAVRSEVLRRAGERRVRTLLDEARAAADVLTAP